MISGKRRAEHRDRGGEDEAGLVAADLPHRLEELARAVEIDAIALLEIALGLARDDGGEVQDQRRALLHQSFGDTRGRDIIGARFHLEGRLWGRGRDHIRSGSFAPQASCRCGRREPPAPRISDRSFRPRRSREHAFHFLPFWASHLRNRGLSVKRPGSCERSITERRPGPSHAIFAKCSQFGHSATQGRRVRAG